MLQLAQAAEDIGDQAQAMVWLIEQDEDVHPILGLALGDSDEVVVQVPVGADSEADGRTLAELQLNIEPGFTVLAIRRGGGTATVRAAGYGCWPAMRSSQVAPMRAANS